MLVSNLNEASSHDPDRRAVDDQGEDESLNDDTILALELEEGDVNLLLDRIIALCSFTGEAPEANQEYLSLREKSRLLRERRTWLQHAKEERERAAQVRRDRNLANALYFAWRIEDELLAGSGDLKPKATGASSSSAATVGAKAVKLGPLESSGDTTKGKQQGVRGTGVRQPARDKKGKGPANPKLECAICFEKFTSRPVSRVSSSRDVIKEGSILVCRHGFCHECISQHLLHKLSERHQPQCPICRAKIHPSNIGKWIDPTILDQLWRVVLADQSSLLYCPNPRCSQPVELDENLEEGDISQCPSCQSLICALCKCLWHEGMGCDEYQALPQEERSMEDLRTLDLARANNWKRCPKCSAIVERDAGCNHVRCRCGQDFCYTCGKKYRTRWAPCSGQAGARARFEKDCHCDLFDVPPEDPPAPQSQTGVQRPGARNPPSPYAQYPDEPRNYYQLGSVQAYRYPDKIVGGPRIRR